MGLNPFSFAVIFFIVAYSVFFLRSWENPLKSAFHATTLSWFFISCVAFLISTFK